MELTTNKTTLPVWFYFDLEKIKKDTYKLKTSLLVRGVIVTVCMIRLAIL